MEHDDWLEFLKEEKNRERTDDNAPSTAAASSAINIELQSGFNPLQTPSWPTQDEEEAAEATTSDTCYMPGLPQVYDDDYVQQQLACDYYTWDPSIQYYQ